MHSPGVAVVAPPMVRTPGSPQDVPPGDPDAGLPRPVCRSRTPPSCAAAAVFFGFRFTYLLVACQDLGVGNKGKPVDMNKFCMTNDDDLFKGKYGGRDDREANKRTCTASVGKPVEEFLKKDLETFIPAMGDQLLFLKAIGIEGLATSLHLKPCSLSVRRIESL